MSIEKLKCTGVLLVGGESSRMGMNKALLDIGGKPLYQRSLEVLDRVCSEVLISCREIDLYTGNGFKAIPDLIKGKGPLGGFYSVIRQAGYDHIFMVACDMPFLNGKAIRYVYSELGEYDMVIPSVRGKLQLLHAFYHKRVLPVVEDQIQRNRLSLIDLLNTCNAKILPVEEGAMEDSDRKKIELSSLNVNTPEQWNQILTRLEEN